MLINTIKRVLSYALYHLKIWNLLIFIISHTRKKPLMAAFTFHRVINETNDSKYLVPYEKGISTKIFEMQLECIQEIFDIIPINNFQDIVLGEVSPKSGKPLALVTFDDGDSEFIDQALPVLKRRNVSAHIFIPTGYIECDTHFWHLRLTNLCNNLTDSDWTILEASDMPDSIKTIFSRYKPDYEVHKRDLRIEIGKIFYRHMRWADVIKLIDEWERLTKVKYNLGIGFLTWDEISSLKDNNITFGSHTVNHLILRDLSIEQIRYELEESRTKLESELGYPVTTICYPLGIFKAEVLDQCEETGYKLGFTIKPGFIDYPLLNAEKYKLRRIALNHNNKHEIFFSIGKALISHIMGRSSKNSN